MFIPDATFICTASRGQLRVAIGAQELKVLWAVVPATPSFVVKNRTEILFIPKKRRQMKHTFVIVAANRQGVLFAPLHVQPPNRGLVCVLVESILTHLAPMQSRALRILQGMSPLL